MFKPPDQTKDMPCMGSLCLNPHKVTMVVEEKRVGYSSVQKLQSIVNDENKKIKFELHGVGAKKLWICSVCALIVLEKSK